jgi:endonuclease/exonuclease/phosphatase (EEP) superfamily protein YafD
VEPVAAYEEDEPPRKRIGGRKTTALLLLLALAFLGIAVLRVLGIDGNQYTIPALALTPYVAPGGVLLALLAFLLRRRFLAVAVLLLAIAVVILLLPRVFANDQPAAEGQRIRVLTANLDRGSADAAALVNLVRDNDIDVLVLPELTQTAVSALDSAHLAEALPHRVFEPGAGVEGSGIAAKFDVRKIILIEHSTLAQPSVVVDLPDRDDLEVIAVHVPAATRGDAARWQRELAALPPTTPNQRARVLAGDFNATWDHAAFRGILDRGYVDAAEQTGRGLLPTWMSAPFGPPIAIDHVLIDRRCAIANYTTAHLPGSDHVAVIAEFVLP